MRTKLATKPLLIERVQIAMGVDQKRRLFDAAAIRGVSVSQLLRDAVDRTAAIESTSGSAP